MTMTRSVDWSKIFVKKITSKMHYKGYISAHAVVRKKTNVNGANRLNVETTIWSSMNGPALCPGLQIRVHI